jgi:hypothetical protein
MGGHLLLNNALLENANFPTQKPMENQWKTNGKPMD